MCVFGNRLTLLLKWTLGDTLAFVWVVYSQQAFACVFTSIHTHDPSTLFCRLFRNIGICNFEYIPLFVLFAFHLHLASRSTLTEITFTVINSNHCARDIWPHLGVYLLCTPPPPIRAPRNLGCIKVKCLCIIMSDWFGSRAKLPQPVQRARLMIMCMPANNIMPSHGIEIVINTCVNRWYYCGFYCAFSWKKIPIPNYSRLHIYFHNDIFIHKKMSPIARFNRQTLCRLNLYFWRMVLAAIIDLLVSVALTFDLFLPICTAKLTLVLDYIFFVCA